MSAKTKKAWARRSARAANTYNRPYCTFEELIRPAPRRVQITILNCIKKVLIRRQDFEKAARIRELVQRLRAGDSITFSKEGVKP